MICRSLLFMLLVGSASAQSATTAYPLTVTVQSSHIHVQCINVSGSSLCSPHLKISAIVGGRNLELEDGETMAKEGILALGDYKAKLVSDQHKKPYLSQQVYEFQYPDGTTEKFAVIGESK